MPITTFIRIFLPSVLALFFFSSAFAADCSGSWQVLPGYSPGTGGACAALGLNTHHPTCQPAQSFATLCDDASGGRYRICQSSIACSPQKYDKGKHQRYRNFRQEERGQRWAVGDRGLGRSPHGPERHEPMKPHRDNYRQPGLACTDWDYSANRPCPPEMVNLDCRHGCASRRY
jgi:hypothetical protein